MLIKAEDIVGVSEKYFDAKQIRASYVPIYINPTQSELLEACSKESKRVRFTANTKNQTVYVWDAMKAVHYDIVHLLGRDYLDVNPHIIGGLVDVVPRPVMVSWDNFHHVMDVMPSSSRSNAIEFLTKLFSYNWTWLDKYFHATDYINKKKFEFEQYLKKPFNKSR
jgi:hypothetical protein